MELIKTSRCEVGQITKKQRSDMEPWIVKATRKKRNNKQQIEQTIKRQDLLYNDLSFKDTIIAMKSNSFVSGNVRYM